MRLHSILVCICCFISLIGIGCSSVKPYQRAYLNDHHMQLGNSFSNNFEENVHAYREGAMGGKSSKSSGGCGCN